MGILQGQIRSIGVLIDAGLDASWVQKAAAGSGGVLSPTPVKALADTGADICFMHEDLTDYLGLTPVDFVLVDTLTTGTQRIRYDVYDVAITIGLNSNAKTFDAIRAAAVDMTPSRSTSSSAGTCWIGSSSPTTDLARHSRSIIRSPSTALPRGRH